MRGPSRRVPRLLASHVGGGWARERKVANDRSAGATRPAPWHTCAKEVVLSLLQTRKAMYTVCCIIIGTSVTTFADERA